MDSKKFATPQKRRLFEDLSDIEPCTAGIHCAIETLSPVKKSQKGVSYYHGVVTDGKNRVPIVGFDTGTQQKLSCFHLRNETVHLDNCLIKKKSQSDDFEILLNKATVVTPSPKKFDVSKVSVETAEDLKIGDLDTIEDGTKVTLKGVVVSLAPVRAVSTGRVQDVTIYDPSGSVNLSVWEENINKLEVGKHYKFCNVYVRSFLGEKNISLSRISNYYVIEDDNCIATTISEEERSEIEAQIIGCQNLTTHISCENCFGKLLKDGEDSVVATCSQCNMVQLIKDKEYEVSANILIKTIPESEKILLKICTENIRKLIPNIDASYSKQKLEEEILQTPTVKLVYIIKNGYVEDIHFI